MATPTSGTEKKALPGPLAQESAIMSALTAYNLLLSINPLTIKLSWKKPLPVEKGKLLSIELLLVELVLEKNRFR